LREGEPPLERKVIKIPASTSATLHTDWQVARFLARENLIDVPSGRR